MILNLINNLVFEVNAIVIDWSQVTRGAVYFVVSVVVVFALLLLTTSILRFQNIISIDDQDEELEPEDAFVIRMTARIATLRSRPPPFWLALLSVGNEAAEGEQTAGEIDPAALGARIHALLRKNDEFSVSKNGEIAFLIETDRDNIRAVEERLKKMTAALELKDSLGNPRPADLRFGCVLFPDGGDKAEKLFESARIALARAQEAETPGCWVFEPPFSAEAESESESKPAEGEGSVPAYIDPVTGLLKAARARSTAQKFLSQFRREGDRASIMIIRIDELERLRQDYGDGVVDQVRSSLSEDLQHQLRHDDLIACWGESGFIVGIDGDEQAAAAVAKRLLSQLRQKKIAYQNYRLRFSVSIGLASYPKNGRLPREILEASELAQREAHDMGRNVFAAFEPKMMKRARETRDAAAF